MSCEEPPDIVLSDECEDGIATEKQCEVECSEVRSDAWDAWTAACPDQIAICAAACDKLYAATACAASQPGRTAEELLAECTAGCGIAVAFPGEPGDYDPDQRYAAGSEEVRVENRSQVELWADCVDRRGCEELSDGYCAVEWWANPNYPCAY